MSVTTLGAAPDAGWRVWRRWVVANVIGEIVGFGLAAMLGTLVAARFAAQGPLRWVIAVAGIVVVGTAEGTAVGLAQWLVLRDCLPALRWRDWLLATMSGAVAAWGVGMAIGSTAGEALALPESAVTVLLGAALIGAAGGVLLSVPQALVLRRAVHAAWRWIPAHAGAWAAGMVVAFAGTGLIGSETPLPVVTLIGAATGLGMGGLVAALTGLALVRLLRDVREAVTCEMTMLAMDPRM
jgi:hypothetical protein